MSYCTAYHTLAEEMYRRTPKERHASDSDRSWQMGYESYDKLCDVDAANHSIGYNMAQENHVTTVMRKPGYYAAAHEAGPQQQRVKFGHDAGYGAAVGAAYPPDPSQQLPKVPIENWTRSYSTSSDAADEKQTITFERPGNTVEFPCFDYSPQVPPQAMPAAAAAKSKLDVCLEQSESSASGPSSKHTSTDYDYARSDMSILTGTHASTNSYNHVSLSYNHTDDVIGDDSGMNNDVASDAQQLSDMNDIVSTQTDRSEFRTSDLDIFSDSSMSAKHSFASASHVSHTQQPPPPADRQQIDGVNAHDSVYGSNSLTPNGADLTEPLSKLQIGPVTSSVHDPDSMDKLADPFNFESPIQMGSVTPEIRLPGDCQTGGGFDESFHTPPITSNFIKSSEIFDDNKVIVNDSVSFFVDKSPFLSATESQQRSIAKSPSTPHEITFNFGDSASISDYPDNLQRMHQKADACFGWGSEDDDDEDVGGDFNAIDFVDATGSAMTSPNDEPLLAREEN